MDIIYELYRCIAKIEEKSEIDPLNNFTPILTEMREFFANIWGLEGSIEIKRECLERNLSQKVRVQTEIMLNYQVSEIERLTKLITQRLYEVKENYMLD